MAQVDLVTLPASAKYVTFEALLLGRSSQQVVGRLLRYWNARNLKKDGEFMGVVLLLFDEKESVIHCFIPATSADSYRHLLEEGCIVNLSGFDVSRCTKLYKITDHPFVIRFLPTTTLTKAATVFPHIAHEKYMLRKVDHLQTLANTNLELPDVIGQIRFVHGSNLTDPTSSQRVVVRFLMDSSVTVFFSLWDDAASTFRAHLASDNHLHSVMLVTTVNPKLFGWNLYLNSTSATRFFFNTNIQAISEFTKSLGTSGSLPFSRVDTNTNIKKMETVSIRELNAYISQTSEQMQEADFICPATIVGVLQRNGWSYVSCAGCSRKLDKNGTTLRCNKSCSIFT